MYGIFSHTCFEIAPVKISPLGLFLVSYFIKMWNLCGKNHTIIYFISYLDLNIYNNCPILHILSSHLNYLNCMVILTCLKMNLYIR